MISNKKNYFDQKLWIVLNILALYAYNLITYRRKPWYRKSQSYRIIEYWHSISLTSKENLKIVI